MHMDENFRNLERKADENPFAYMQVLRRTGADWVAYTDAHIESTRGSTWGKIHSSVPEYHRRKVEQWVEQARPFSTTRPTRILLAKLIASVDDSALPGIEQDLKDVKGGYEKVQEHLSLLCIERGDIDHAIEISTPKDSKFHEQLGYILLHQKKYEESLETSRKIGDVDKRLGFLRNWVEHYTQNHSLEEAIEIGLITNELNPNFYGHLCEVALSQENSELALRAYKKASSGETKRDIRRLLTHYFCERRQYDQAKKLLASKGSRFFEDFQIKAWAGFYQDHKIVDEKRETFVRIAEELPYEHLPGGGMHYVVGSLAHRSPKHAKRLIAACHNSRGSNQRIDSQLLSLYIWQTEGEEQLKKLGLIKFASDERKYLDHPPTLTSNEFITEVEALPPFICDEEGSKQEICQSFLAPRVNQLSYYASPRYPVGCFSDDTITLDFLARSVKESDSASVNEGKERRYFFQIEEFESLKDMIFRLIDQGRISLLEKFVVEKIKPKSKKNTFYYLMSQGMIFNYHVHSNTYIASLPDPKFDKPKTS